MVSLWLWLRLGAFRQQELQQQERRQQQMVDVLYTMAVKRHLLRYNVGGDICHEAKEKEQI